MSRRPVAWIAWGLAAAVIVVSLLTVIEAVRRGEFAEDPTSFWSDVIEVLIAPIFALLGALILSNQPRNVVGWLIMTPAVASAVIGPISLWLVSFDPPPSVLDPGLFLAIWIDNWSWLLLIFPIFHLLQVFPTGRILTRRWRWLAYLELGMFMFFIGLVAFSREMGPSSEVARWTVENPIGFIGTGFWEGGFLSIWTLGLLILVIGGAASTVVRYRRARAAEKQQLKWLLYVLVLFAVVYSVTAVLSESSGSGIDIIDVLFLLSIFSIPVAITVAVLRYRLFDIDLIIRKTLVYGLLTGLLAGVYLGSVVVLQGLFRGDDNSSVSVAASTLLIVALFTPLRRRVQTLIDRRLFRSKYNAQKVIERFGSAAGNQANLEKLSADLLAVVEETIQPQFGGLWIREPAQGTARPRAGSG